MMRRSLLYFLIFHMTFLESSRLTSKSITKNRNSLPSGDLKDFFATTIDGLEKVLARELSNERIRGSDVTLGKCGVFFKGNISTVLSALMWSRNSIKIMEKIADVFDVTNKDDLHHMVNSINWDLYLGRHSTLKVDCAIGQTTRELSHTHFNCLTVKNAIVDQFREKYGIRPNVDIENPDLSLFLYMHRGQATLYRVWSGEESLHKRGYRQVVHRASLRETTAAALLRLSDWDYDEQSLCDPMCGSGTFVIEAALMASNTAPGLIRYGPADQTDTENQSRPPPKSIFWPDVKQSDWDSVWHEAKSLDKRNTFKKGSEPRIYANDWHKGALELAIRGAGAAGVHRMIDFSCQDVASYEPKVNPGVILTNPPWDRRLEGGEESWMKLNTFAQRIKASSECPIWVLSGNKEMEKFIEVPIRKKFQLKAASIDLDFIRFQN